VWVGVDATIRKETKGAKSLDDFCKLFFGGRDTGPMIAPYTYQDLLQSLNSVCPYDWNAYFQRMVYDVHPEPTTEGIEMAGWRLVYESEPPAPRTGGGGRGRGFSDHTYDIGVSIDGSGNIGDMVIGSPADRAGLGPSMKIVKVGDKDYSNDVLTAAINEATKTRAPILLQVSKEGVTSTVNVNYIGGMRYPRLQRIEGTTDYLSEIAKPKTASR
jgi:predicted metalloprotease with PDZ domain